jgi:hypothetical protein
VVRESSDEAAYFHILGVQICGVVSDPTLRCLQSKVRNLVIEYEIVNWNQEAPAIVNMGIKLWLS